MVVTGSQVCPQTKVPGTLAGGVASAISIVGIPVELVFTGKGAGAAVGCGGEVAGIVGGAVSGNEVAIRAAGGMAVAVGS